MRNGSQQWIVLSEEQWRTLNRKCFTKMRYTASMVIIIITWKYTCPLHSIREIVFVLCWKVQYPSADWRNGHCLYIYPRSVKKSRTITVVDIRMQYDFQLCCDPAYLGNQNLRWIIPEQSAKTASFYKDETILKTFWSSPIKYFWIRIIFTEKSSNLKILPFSTRMLTCPKHPIRNKHRLEQTQQNP